MHKIVPPFVAQLLANLKASPQFVQVILGPRQVGKTTGVLQFLADAKGDSAYFSADDALAPNGFWIEEKWQQAQSQAKDCILVIDEIHKIPEWSNAVKKLWDRQRKDNKTKIKLILLGSSSLQIQSGLSESLTGRFQVIRATHWSLVESKKLINFTVQKFAQFGGYPGSYALLKNPKVWEKYIRESIVETVIGKDILNIGRIKKPALFRQAFEILMSHPAQEISYTKLL